MRKYPTFFEFFSVIQYVNTTEIIRKVAFTLSNSNNDFDFVGQVIKIPCLFYFRCVKLPAMLKKNTMLEALWR